MAAFQSYAERLATGSPQPMPLQPGCIDPCQSPVPVTSSQQIAAHNLQARSISHTTRRPRRATRPSATFVTPGLSSGAGSPPPAAGSLRTRRQ